MCVRASCPCVCLLPLAEDRESGVDGSDVSEGSGGDVTRRPPVLRKKLVNAAAIAESFEKVGVRRTVVVARRLTRGGRQRCVPLCMYVCVLACCVVVVWSWLCVCVCMSVCVRAVSLSVPLLW